MRQTDSPISSVLRPSLLAYCLEWETVRFSLKMALVVGTLLAIINHGYALLTGHFMLGEVWSVLLTYCVPFAVSMYSQVQGKRQRDLANKVAEDVLEQRAGAQREREGKEE